MIKIIGIRIVIIVIYIYSVGKFVGFVIKIFESLNVRDVSYINIIVM